MEPWKEVREKHIQEFKDCKCQEDIVKLLTSISLAFNFASLKMKLRKEK